MRCRTFPFALAAILASTGAGVFLAAVAGQCRPPSGPPPVALSTLAQQPEAAGQQPAGEPPPTHERGLRVERGVEQRDAAAVGTAIRRPRRRLTRGSVPAFSARQNLVADPWGRVIDVVFQEPFALAAPWDRFRFDIDAVQPLMRDGGAFLGDLDGDGVRDLIVASFYQEVVFFRGVAGDARRFGDGAYLRCQVPAGSNPFAMAPIAVYSSGDLGDLDGDGKPELVIGCLLYRNVGTAAAPLFELAYTFRGYGLGFDPTASLGDLDGDGKLDVVITSNYLGGFHLFLNHSTPGVWNFSHQELYSPASLFDPVWQPDNRLVVGDLNGDGLLDLAGGAGIYFNTGTRRACSFDFSKPTPWVVIDGPLTPCPAGGVGAWCADNDLGTDIHLVDTDGNGTLDAYVSGHDETAWQVLFYRNVGTPQQPRMRYEGPVEVSSTPVSLYYRGEEAPSYSGSRAYVAAGDVDGNGRPEVLISTNGGETFGAPGIVWNWPTNSPVGLAAVLSYPDLYTLPSLPNVDYRCGLPLGSSPDALCKPPNLFAAWVDLTHDGRPDALRIDHWMNTDFLYLRERTGDWPFTLKADAAYLAAGSGAPVVALGVALVDVDRDGATDLVAGAEDGTLSFFRNTATDGTLALTDSVPLTDDAGNPIDVGDQSWPAPFDLDGDGDVDFLVASYDGTIRKVFCTTPGRVNGYTLGGLLGAREQDPVDVQDLFGGGWIVPALATIDVDLDGRPDVAVGDVMGHVWLLHNLGTAGAPDFSLAPLSVSRTAAAYLKLIDARTVQVRFAIPAVPGSTRLAVRDLPVGGTSLSDEVVVEAGTDPAPTPPPLPKGCSFYASTDVPHFIPFIPSNWGSEGVTSIIEVAEGHPITDVNVIGLIGSGPTLWTLKVELASPAGTKVTLVDPRTGVAAFCSLGAEFRVGFDDAATSWIPCPSTDGQLHTPAKPLAAFNGESPVGTWKLRLFSPSAKSAPGSLNAWALVICEGQT
jgi:hypothetical protein